MDSMISCISASVDANKCTENAKEKPLITRTGEVTPETCSDKELNKTKQRSETVNGSGESLDVTLAPSCKVDGGILAKCISGESSVDECAGQAVASIAKQSPPETSETKSDFPPTQGQATATVRLIQSNSSSRHVKTVEPENRTVNVFSVEREIADNVEKNMAESSLGAVPSQNTVSTYIVESQVSDTSSVDNSFKSNQDRNVDVDQCVLDWYRKESENQHRQLEPSNIIEERQHTVVEPPLENLKADYVTEQSKKQQKICEESLLGSKHHRQEDPSVKEEHQKHEEPPSKKLKTDCVIEQSQKQQETTCEESITGETTTKLDFQFDASPRQLTGAWKCFSSNEGNNYLRGCKWAPDGTCLLTNSNDNCLRLFNLPEQLYQDGGENQLMAEMSPVLKMQESGTVYDYCWYPNMSSADPVTACLAVCSKDTPIHLYDGFSGEIRCSYRPYNHMDELVAPHCVSFDPEGDKLYCGFNKTVRVFDVTRPGRECQSRPTFAKSGQRGIISCIAHSPSEPGLYAAGSFSRTIALYQEPKGEMICMFEGQQGGVTQIMFSPDGSKLYSGGRKDDEVLCWDLRNPGRILFTLLRSVRTNQRMYFDLSRDGKYVVSGSHNGTVLVWDTTKPAVTLDVLAEPVLQPVMMYQAHSDAVNGLSLHPSLPMIATSSGQRHFPTYGSDSEDDSVDHDQIDNSVRLWWVRDTGVQ